MQRARARGASGTGTKTTGTVERETIAGTTVTGGETNGSAKTDGGIGTTGTGEIVIATIDGTTRTGGATRGMDMTVDAVTRGPRDARGGETTMLTEIGIDPERLPTSTTGMKNDDAWIETLLLSVLLSYRYHIFMYFYPPG